MFGWLAYRYDDWRGERIYRRARAQRIRQHRALSKDAQKEEHHRFREDLERLQREDYEGRLERYSDYLLDRAFKLKISMPPYKLGETYIERTTDVGTYLSQEARISLRDAIRRERRERSEVLRLWLSAIGAIIGAITGLVGALIGLLALWYKIK